MRNVFSVSISCSNKYHLAGGDGCQEHPEQGGGGGGQCGSGCEQVSAQARQTRSPIPAVTAPGMEMFLLRPDTRGRYRDQAPDFKLSLSDPFTAAVSPFFVLI